MRRYSQLEEERIRVQTMVREWARSNLLDPLQSARLEAELRVDVKRTNNFLRVGLALFTCLIVGAAVALVITGWNLRSEVSIATVAAVAALICIGLAEILVGRFRFYRFGVEEALSLAAVVLLSMSGAELLSEPPYGRFGETSKVVALLIAAAGGLGIYLRFGFVYAAVGSMACAAAIPFQLYLSAPVQHLLAAVMLASVFLYVRSRRLRFQDDYPGDEYGSLQAAAWTGLYLTLNLQFWWERLDGWFYWFSYLMIWLLPVVGLRLGIRGKDRPLVDASLVIALITLLTNKRYLHWPQNTWDPIVLGVFLIAVVLVIRRWLSSGPGGERAGFSSVRLVSRDEAALRLLSAASTSFQPNAPASQPDPRTSDFGGGRSGGGGGGATY